MSKPITVFWFRRDLRLEDNTALFHALKSGNPVLPIFIFDKDILNQLSNPADARVDFIHQNLAALHRELKKSGSGLLVMHDTASNAFAKLLEKYPVHSVFLNHDYEPGAIRRDAEIKELLGRNGVALHSFKDQVIFEKNEVMSDSGNPYQVYTPYSRKWKSMLNSTLLQPMASENLIKKFFAGKFPGPPTLEELGFKSSGKKFPPVKPSSEIIRDYHLHRDIPFLNATSHLGIHLRFGTISIRKLVSFALETNETFLNELIWREFFMQILWHFPRLERESYKLKYEKIRWRNDEGEFNLWCKGKTGYPIVDAGMRELVETGFMHNRVRMITASFLVKHLLIDWRWGETFFASHLLDFELSSNNGNWQWAAGCGCDAAPYFRIFNPLSQQEKFDPDFEYVKRWVPEFGSDDYTQPIVDHKAARERCLAAYSVVKEN